MRDGKSWIAGLLLIAATLGPASGPAGGDEETRARWFATELARADSLLAAGRAGPVAERVEQILDQIGDDPVYAWQFQERLGVARLELGDAAGALEVLEASARAQPDRPSVHRNLATTLMALGRRGRALSEYRQALELAPRDCEIRLEFGQVLLEFRNTAEAAVHLRRARELCGERRDVRLAMARCRLAERSFDEAADLLADLYRERPDPRLRSNWQAALLGAGRDRELYGMLRGMSVGEMDPQTAQLLIEAEGRLGRTEVVRRQVDLLDDPEGATLPVAVGMAASGAARFWGTATLNLLAAGEPEKALRAADRAIELEPDNVVYRNNRVVALTRLGREDEARSEWKRVLELDPSLAGPDDEDPMGDGAR